MGLKKAKAKSFFNFVANTCFTVYERIKCIYVHDEKVLGLFKKFFCII